MLSSPRREMFRALRNQLKISWKKNGPINSEKSRRNRNRFAAVVATAAASVAVGSVAVKNSQRVFDEDLTSKPLGSVYNFQESEIVDSDQLPLEYDVEKITSYWSKRTPEVVKRTAQILSILLPYFHKVVIWEYLIRGKIRDHPGLQKKYAVELRQILTELGPCFIKFGQAMSIRPDLLPAAFLVELQKLCDSVPSFPTQEAIEVIESELGVGASQRLFEDFNSSTIPIAAASLGQVYKLKLKNQAKNVDEKAQDWWCRCSKHCKLEDDTFVAVKVQRPDMINFVLRDLYIMRRFAQVIEKFRTTFTYNRPYDVQLLDTFAGASLKELDYINEASNQEEFRKEFLHRMGSKVYIPAVHANLTTRKVLVSEWIEGKQLAKSESDVINRLTAVGVECFLVQLLETGRFHADPHPGNLLVTQTGKLALIDFGLCAEVPLPDTKNMTLAIVHLMQGDVPGLVGDAINLGFLPPEVDQGKLLPALQKVFDEAQLAMKEEFRMEAINKTKFKAVVTRRKKFMAVSNDLNLIFFKYPFLVPDYFALITRAMIVLEGIAMTGDPEFDLFNSAYPYAFKRAISLFGLSNLTEIAKEAAKNNEIFKIINPKLI